MCEMYYYDNYQWFNFIPSFESIALDVIQADGFNFHQHILFKCFVCQGTMPQQQMYLKLSTENQELAITGVLCLFFKDLEKSKSDLDTELQQLKADSRRIRFTFEEELDKMKAELKRQKQEFADMGMEAKSSVA